MALSSVVRPISAGTAGGPTRSGAIWLKWIAKSAGADPSQVVLVKTQGAYSVLRLGGNCVMLKATFAAAPGANGKEPVITCYMVPGAFTPTAEVPYPAPVGPATTATFVAVRGTLNSIDHLEFVADLNVGFTSGQAQLVVLSDTGAYQVIPYDQETLPQLTAVNISSAYPGARTGFTSGDAVNFSFSASSAVTQVAVWPHDSVLVSGVPTGTPQIITLGAPAASGSFTATLAAISATAFAAAGKAYVAAYQYGQWSTPVQTSGTFVFDERSPSFSGATAGYSYPGTQSAIKASDQCTVNVTGVTTTGGGTLTGTVAANFSATNRLAPVGTPPFAVTAGASSFAVQRGASGYNGRAYLTLTATNSNNGKTAASSGTFVGVDVQDTAFAAPTLTVNGGNPISTAVGGTAVTVSISSVVETINPTGHVTLPQVSLGTWATADGGYTWTCTGTVADLAVRNTYPPTLSTYLTAAGTTITALTGTYKISGFVERAFTVAQFATTVALGALPVDYQAGLVVKNLAFDVTPHTYTAIGNFVTLTDTVLTDNNASPGGMPVYISQSASP